MVKEAYCSYELAELLKEKGFPQVKPVCGYFITGMVYSISINANGEHRLVPQYPERVYNKDKYIAAPTHQTAMKWLRDIHKIHIEIWATYDTETEEHTGWGITVTDLSDFGGVYLADSSGYKTYEEAVEVALKHVLENLI